MSTEDEIIAICSNENSGNTIGIWAHCRKCDTDVWLSDSTIESIKTNYPDTDILENPPVLLCIGCGLEHIKDSKSQVITKPTEKQLAEIINAIKNIDKQK